MDNKKIIEQLKAIKSLYDAGAITQEEFEKKKKLILETPEEKKARELEEEKQKQYEKLSRDLDCCVGEGWLALSKDFEKLGDYLDSKNKAQYAKDRYSEFVNEKNYQKALDNLSSDDIITLKETVVLLEKIHGKDNTKELIDSANEKILRIQKEIDELNRIKEEERKKKNKRNAIIAGVVAMIAVLLICLYNFVYLPNKTRKESYEIATQLVNEENYIQAGYYFANSEKYRDSSVKKEECYNVVLEKLNNCLESGDNDNLGVIIEELQSQNDFVTSELDSMVRSAIDEELQYLKDNNKNTSYVQLCNVISFDYLGEDYRSSYNESARIVADRHFESGDYDQASVFYLMLGDEGIDPSSTCSYKMGEKYQEMNYYTEALEYYSMVEKGTSSYSYAKDRIKECKYGQIIMSYNSDHDLTGTERSYLKDLYADSYFRDKVSYIYKRIYKK